MTQGSKTTLFNPGTTPVVCDKEGHIVDGGGRREVDKVDKVAQEAIDHGLLVEEKPDEPETTDKEAPAQEVKPSRKTSGASETVKPA